jgi:hypothetical protein
MTFTAALLESGASSSFTVDHGENKTYQNGSHRQINIHLPVKTVDEILRIIEEREGESTDKRKDASPSETESAT